MFRVSFVIIALASGLALNGCSQCSKTETAETPVVVPVAVPVEATPVDAAAAPAAPMDANAPAATPADATVPAATPAQ